MIEGYKWYKREQAKAFAPILSCFRLILKDSSGDTCPGYYACGRFYCENIDLTDSVMEWMIPQAGENPHPNN
jgi:hypothetical protein